jgi:proton-dependent oligopeptide transporter, POT family
MRKRDKFPNTFWIANIIELFERFAWYGMFMLFALYLTGSKDTGALGFSQQEKGLIMGPIVFFLYLLPVITGAIADRFGYKKILLLAFGIMSSAYFMLAYATTVPLVFSVFIFLAIGAALFKPVITATIAKSTNDSNSSIGFGIFYMMVNIGAFLGPIFASKFRELDWQYVFFISAAIIVFNFFLVLFFYKEPPREKTEGSLKSAIIKIFKNIGIAFSDFKFIVFLLIIVGFWAMYNQLFYSLPVFIADWMDTSILYDKIYTISPWLAENIGTKNNTIAPEMLTNIDALYIIIFQVLVSTAVMKLKPLNAMISGIFISSIGIGLMFAFSNPMYLFISILIFGVGEMSSSPKITEYIGKIAPKDKIALYMGCSYLPMAGGNLLAGILSGPVYEKQSDKIYLITKELESRGQNVPELTDSFTKNDLLAYAEKLTGMDGSQLTSFLWDKYHPENIWILYASIGMGTVIALFLFDRLVLRKKAFNT